MPNIPIKSYLKPQHQAPARGLVHCPWCHKDWPQTAYYTDTMVERNFIKDEWVCPSPCDQPLRKTQEVQVQQERQKRAAMLEAQDQGFSQPQASAAYDAIVTAEEIRQTGDRKAYIEALRRVALALTIDGG